MDKTILKIEMVPLVDGVALRVLERCEKYLPTGCQWGMLSTYGAESTPGLSKFGVFLRQAGRGYEPISWSVCNDDGVTVSEVERWLREAIIERWRGWWRDQDGLPRSNCLYNDDWELRNPARYDSGTYYLAAVTGFGLWVWPDGKTGAEARFNLQDAVRVVGFEVVVGDVSLQRETIGAVHTLTITVNEKEAK